MHRLAFLSIIALASAARSRRTLVKRASVDWNATFDDVDDAATSLSQTGILGWYNYLYWNNMGVMTAGDGATNFGGVIVASAPNVLAYGLVGQGSRSFYVGQTAWFATKQFNLYSFYYGCVVVDGGGLPENPVGCKVNIKGYNHHQEVIATQTITFTPSGQLPVAMEEVVLNNTFKHLTLVKLETTSLEQSAGVSTVLMLDNVEYTAYGKLKKE